MRTEREELEYWKGVVTELTAGKRSLEAEVRDLSISLKEQFGQLERCRVEKAELEQRVALFRAARNLGLARIDARDELIDALEAEVKQLTAMKADYESARDCICWGVDCVHEARALNMCVRTDYEHDQTKAKLARAVEALRTGDHGHGGTDGDIRRCSFCQALRELGVAE